MLQVLAFPNTFSTELKSLLQGLLERDCLHRLGCGSHGIQEIKEHIFFKDINWQQVYNHENAPPLIPPRGEVNAADAFDIGSFDEEDTKGIKLTESDQNLYKNFALIVSERWQLEIAETVFSSVNYEADKVRFSSSHSPKMSIKIYLLQIESKKKAKKFRFGTDEKGNAKFVIVIFFSRDRKIGQKFL